MTDFALRIDFVPWQPLYRTAATPSCSLWYSNPQSQRESEVMQLETSTTRPQCSVLGLVVICSDNNRSVRAVTLRFRPTLESHRKGKWRCFSTKLPNFSLSLYLFTFSLLPFKHLSIWCYVFCLCLRYCHRKMPIQSIIRCLPNSYLMITFPIPILHHVECYYRQVLKEVTFPIRAALKKWSVEHLHSHLNVVIWRKEWSKRHLRGRRIHRVWLLWGLYFLYK
jgi:hypothetical protein